MVSPASSTDSKYLITITPDQRKALLSSQHNLHELEPTLIRSLKDTFDTEGFVLVRGLLDEQTIDRTCSAGQGLTGKKPTTKNSAFNALEFGPAFNVEEEAFRNVALNSAIPGLVARVLLGVDSGASPPTNMRLLKDAFFAKGKEENHCGWHVDDAVFWPTQSSSSGVNVWLALDDIHSKYGGGLAISPGSHQAEWKQQAYETIGSTPTLPPEGFNPAGATIPPTCDMAKLNSELHDRIESSKLEFDYQPGDCLFCDRWLFHRSVPINQEGLEHYDDDSALKRYTIRYERGTAKLLKGMSFESSIVMNPDNSGRSLDEVCEQDAIYYPQCWPKLEGDKSEEQRFKIEILARENLPAAKAKKMELMKKFFAATKEKEASSM